MLDFTPWRRKEIDFAELGDGLTVDDLRRLTHEMVDSMLAIIAPCDDFHVTFTPQDPTAHDPYAEDPDETDLAWNLAHLVVHTTASAEEAAALAAELARGVPYHGRSRSEVPWRSVTTIAQCRARLEESRRMRLASLDMWPDEPRLDETYPGWGSLGQINAVDRFILGLAHDDDHLEQMREVVRQARAARNGR